MDILSPAASTCSETVTSFPCESSQETNLTV